VITAWAGKRGRALPEAVTPPSLNQVKLLQDFGEQMRAEKTASGEPDHAAIARTLVLKIRELRAEKTQVTVEKEKGQPVRRTGLPVPTFWIPYAILQKFSFSDTSTKTPLC
jgi:hypothetical protein